MNPGRCEKMREKSRGSHIVLLQIDPLRCQQKELEHIVGQR